ncbi:MAG TPA: hypothetical protein GX515_12285 [Firmicutes bacterium]|nr:hypothetical protein [Bacillota bacterium]
MQLKLLHKGKSERLGGPRSLRRATRKALLFVALWVLGASAATFLYLRSPNASTEEVAQYSTQVVAQAAEFFRADLTRYEDISFQFVANQDLNNLLIEYVNAKDPYEVAEHNQRFSNFLEGLAFSDRALQDALFLDEHNTHRKALTMGESLSIEFIRSFRASEAYQAILRADGKAVWIGSVRTGKSDRYYVMMGRRIKTLFTGEPLGVLVMFIREDYLRELLTKYLDENFYFSIGTVKSSHVLLADHRGTVISAPAADNIGKGVAEVFEDGRRLAPQLKNGRGRFIGKIGDADVLIIFQSIPETQWTLLVPVSPRTGLHSGVRPPLTADALAFFAALAAFGLTSAVLWSMWWPWLRQRSGGAMQTQVVGASGLAGLPTLRYGGFAPARAQSTAQRARGGSTGQGSTSPQWLDELTAREKQILGFLAQGYSNREIAELVHMAEQTVKNYVSTIYLKMGVHDRVQASLMAVEAGLGLKESDDDDAARVRTKPSGSDEHH